MPTSGIASASCTSWSAREKTVQAVHFPFQVFGLHMSLSLVYYLFIMPGSASVLIPAQATTFAHQIAQCHQSPALSRLKLTCGTWNISNSPAFSLTFSKVTLSGLAKLYKAAQKGHLPNHSKKSQKPMPCCAARWRACERRRSRAPAIAETRIETQLCLCFPAPGDDIMDFKNKERMTTLVTSN